MGIWNSPDGDTRLYGTDKAIVTVGGEFNVDTSKKFVELKFDSTRLLEDFPAEVADDAGEVILSQRYALPIGALIEGVEIVTYTDWDSAGDAFVFNLGTIDMDGTSNGDHDSLIDAATQTEMNTGGLNIAGWVGALVNATPLTTAKLLTWEVNGAESTAGESIIRIFYSVQ